jgi:DNA repair exonuclease SbcCD ATPase subunit
LGSILNMTTPPLLVIDEGFSALDKDHIEGLPILLNFIKTKFNYILYISHNDDIKGMGDYNILVEKVLGKSKISVVNN